MHRTFSKRAEILGRLLPHINAGNYTEYESLIVFGASTAEDVLDQFVRSPNEREDQSRWEAVHNFLSDFKVHGGREQLATRLSLERVPSFKSDALDGLSPADFRWLRKMFEGALPQVQKQAERSQMEPGTVDEDTIDAAITEELLGRLPKAVSRAARLDQMSLERVPNKDLRRYFHEAHRCYLYGFNVACVVLCRAILESSLKSVCDPHRLIKKQVPTGKSYFKALVVAAERDGLLTDDRPGCAIKVKNAGDDAIHDYSNFERCWVSKLGEVLDDTRKVLLDLFRSESETSHS
jgi:hypothetical protein